MLLIYGKKTARLKSTTDHHERCKKCGAFDISVAVFQEYFHFFYIPVWPIGPKNMKAWCHECGQPFGSVSFEKEYEDQARTPVYFYTIPILVLILIVLAVFGNISTQKEKAAFVQNPKAGDIYQIRKVQKDTILYYFLKIEEIKGDRIIVFHNERIYLSYATTPAVGDAFVTTDTLAYTRRELQQMLDAGEINAVQR